MNGIFCGKDSTVAVADEFYIAFLRLGDGRILSILKHTKDGVVGIVSGKGAAVQYSNVTDEDSLYCFKDTSSGTRRYNDDGISDAMDAHNGDRISIDSDGSMTYTMYDGTIFSLKLSEETGEDYFDRLKYGEPKTVSKKMAVWNIRKHYNSDEGGVWVGIDTKKYSILFQILDNDKNKTIYCRVGQNGYCEKGWAMRSTTCIRPNECRMIENNLDTAKDYVPDKRWFMEGSCNFPLDGGWYWSLQSVSENEIRVNGCGGSEYIISRD